MSGNNNVFVFVVCGAAEHIRTLNFSLCYLKHFSKNKIIVVTDLSRNESEIIHDNIMNFQTPGNLDNHQASIFLKTSLHRILPIGNLYCYLDTDVIALSSEVDTIFRHFTNPITFASDQFRINIFSPHALNCSCKERYEESGKKLRNLMDIQEKYITDNPHLLEEFHKLEEIVKHFEENKNEKIWKILPRIIQDFLGTPYYNFDKFFKRNGNFKWDYEEHQWRDGNDTILFDEKKYKNYVKNIESSGEYKLDTSSDTWLNNEGKPAFIPQCNHLIESIRNKFDINITEDSWLQWNGGVFLFNEQSVSFMEDWHNYTMQIFNDPYFKTRDQGTLAAVTWKYNLQNAPRLPQEFNFIADANTPGIDYLPEKGFTKNDFKSILNPSFIHVFHDFGKKGWRVWDAIEKVLPEK